MIKASIKQQICLIGIIAIVGILLLLFLQHTSNQKMQSLENIRVDLLTVESDVLMLRRNEKDFIARKQLKYVEKYNQNHQLMIERSQGFVNELEDHGLDHKKADKLITVLNNYKDDFLSIVDIQKKVGLDSKSGFYGELREAAHQAEEKIFELDNDKLAKDMLILRRREKDFMLRLDVKYIEKFDKDFAVFNQDLESEFMSYEAKQQIEGFMKKYDQDFKNLTQVNIQLGLSSSEGAFGKMRSTVHQSEELLENLIKKTEKTIKSEEGKLATIMLLFGFIAAIVIIVLVLLIMRSIIAPIESFSNLMSKAAKGLDITARADEKAPKEIAIMAQSFNCMIKEFHSALSQIKNISSELNNASGTLDGVSATVNNIVSNQLNESEKISIAMNEMTATVQDVALNANTAAAAAESADTQAHQGKSVVSENQAEIATLARNVNDAAIVIGELSKESENIGTVLSVIREIAEQTNLLALNAAIEAARAGDQGRGFAVVADEVRTLAQRSQESTEEIKTIVERLQQTAEQAVQAMETGKEQAQKSVERSHVASEILQVIEDAISSIKDMNFQIATASEEQTAVSEEINRNIVNITEITKETCESTNSTVQAGKTLTETASRISDLVQKFTI